MSKKTSYLCSYNYLTETLQLTQECPRRKCPGVLTEVWVRYVPVDKYQQNRTTFPIKKEFECTCCGKVIRPYRSKPRTHAKQYFNRRK